MHDSSAIGDTVEAATTSVSAFTCSQHAAAAANSMHSVILITLVNGHGMAIMKDSPHRRETAMTHRY